MAVIISTDRLLVESDPDRTVLDGVDVTDLHVTMADIMKAGHCISGTGRWFETQELDYRKFVREGVEASALLRKGDGFAVIVVGKKLERENGR